MLIAVSGEIKGLDTDDNEYSSIQDLWNSELKPTRTKKVTNSQAELSASQTEWYSKAFDYWESDVNCPITDGKNCKLLYCKIVDAPCSFETLTHMVMNTL